MDSVRAQRYGGRIEHIVIERRIGDDVVDYLSGCRAGVHVLAVRARRRKVDAMNQGIAHASGDLLVVSCTSRDRFADPDTVAQVVEAFSAHGSVRDVWGYGLQNAIGPDGRRLALHSGICPLTSVGSSLVGWVRSPSASFFGSSLVSKLGGYDLDFGIAADQLFIFRAALQREPITIPRILSEFDMTGARIDTVCW